MPSKSRLMCYFGCDIVGSLHWFPKPQQPNMEKFNAWKLVLDNSVQNKDNNYIYNQIRICNRHFEKHYYLPSHRLTPNAVPTLNVNVQSSTLREDIPSVQYIMEPSTSSMVLPNKSETYVKGVKKQSCVTSKHLEIIRLKKRLLKLSLKCKSLHKKIRTATKLSKNKDFLKIVDKLPDSIKTFTSLQLMWTQKPRGRRFSTDDKVMALTIFKQSQKAYNLLSNLFVLPSKRTIQKLKT